MLVEVGLAFGLGFGLKRSFSRCRVKLLEKGEMESRVNDADLTRSTLDDDEQHEHTSSSIQRASS